jgi:hypothetical protein
LEMDTVPDHIQNTADLRFGGPFKPLPSTVIPPLQMGLAS